MTPRQAAIASMLGVCLFVMVLLVWRADRPPLFGAESDRPRTCIVRSGDTLSAIAARELGNAKRWPLLALWNQLENPDDLHVGDVLFLEEPGR